MGLPRPPEVAFRGPRLHHSESKPAVGQTGMGQAGPGRVGTGPPTDFPASVPLGPILDLRPETPESRALTVISQRPTGRAGLRSTVTRSLSKWRAAMRVSVAHAVALERDHGHGSLALPLMLGLGAFVWFSAPVTPSIVLVGLVLALAFLLAVYLRNRNGGVSLLACWTCLSMLGMGLAAFETWRLDTILLDTPVTTNVSGVVLARETDERGRWRYDVALVSTADPQLGRAPERVRLLSRSVHEPVAIGSGIAGRARLSPPSGPALPGLNDFAFDAFFSGIGAVGFFYGAPNPIAADPARISRLDAVWNRMASLRATIGDRIRTVLPGDPGAIAAALVTDEERAISRETIETLRQAGLAHVLAISGLNMVLAAGTFMVGARALMAAVPGLAHCIAIKKIAALGALVMVSLYILISGGSVSAIRSYVMIAIMLVAVLLDRPSITLRNIALAATMIIVVTPSAVTGPGFQMSFAATLALVAGYERWRRRPAPDTTAQALPGLARLEPLRNFMAGLLLSSLIGGLSTLVYSAGHFHRIAAYGLAGNVLAMPIISLIVMPMAVVSMLLMPLGLDHLTLPLLGLGLEWTITIAKVVASWGGEIVTGRMPPAAFVLIAVGGLVVCLLRSFLALLGLVPLVLGLLLALLPQPQAPSILVSDDGRLVALLADGTASLNRRTAPDFIFDQWRRALAIRDTTPPIELAGAGIPKEEPKRRDLEPLSRERAQAFRRDLDRLLVETPAGRFACQRAVWCVATTREGWRVVTVEDARLIGLACDQANLVVVPLIVRLAQCRSGATLVTARTLRKTGALTLSSEPGANGGASGLHMHATFTHLDRPWSRHRAYDWRSRTFDDRQESPVAINHD